MQNPNSASSIKMFLSIIFLFAFMYLIYFILNKKSSKQKNDVVYGNSYTKPSEDLNAKLSGILDKVSVIKTDPIPVKPDTTDIKPDTTDIDDKTDIKPDTTNDDKSFLERLNDNIRKLPISGKGNFEKKIKEVDTICNELKDIFTSPISIQKVTQGIEAKLQNYNGQNKQKIEDMLNLLKEINLIGIDTNISNFCNRVVKIINGSGKELENALKRQNKIQSDVENKEPEKNADITNLINNSTFITEITTAFNEEMSGIKDKLAEMIKRIYPDIQIAISITQIYNSGFESLFLQAQPEIGLLCFVITQLYPKETKAGLTNTLSSAASIGFNSAKSGFGRMFGSKNDSVNNNIV